MGIDNIGVLTDNEQDCHVVVVGRAGGHPGSGIYVTHPGTKREAILTGEKIFRKENDLAPNIALQSSVAHSGSDVSCVLFVTKMMQKMDEAKEG